MARRNHNLNLQDHPGYFVCTDGLIAKLDSMGRVVAAPTFVGDGDLGDDGHVYVVLPETITYPDDPKKRDRLIGRAYLAAPLIIKAFTGEEAMPKFADGDTTNLALSNLMPDKQPVKKPMQRPEHDAGLIPCPHCDHKGFKTEAGLASHVRSKHPED